MRNFLLGILFTLICIAIGGYAVLRTGLYPVNADADASWLERRITGMATHYYISGQTKTLKNPLTPTPEVLMAGMKSFKSNCAGCHGSPAHKDDTFSRAMFPKAPHFGLRGIDSDELLQSYWITKHGVRMTGMPSFANMMSDKEIWEVANFIVNVDQLPPAVKAEWELTN